jgi:hypothetical protein
MEVLSLNFGPHKFSLEASFFLNLREGQTPPMIFSQTHINRLLGKLNFLQIKALAFPI